MENFVFKFVSIRLLFNVPGSFNKVFELNIISFFDDLLLIVLENTLAISKLLYFFGV